MNSNLPFLGSERLSDVLSCHSRAHQEQSILKEAERTLTASLARDGTSTPTRGALASNSVRSCATEGENSFAVKFLYESSCTEFLGFVGTPGDLPVTS